MGQLISSVQDLKEEVKEIKEEIKEVKGDLEALTSLRNRGVGILIASAAFFSMIGWALNHFTTK